MKDILVFALLFLSTGLFAQGTVEGILKDSETGEPLLFANVVFYQAGVFKYGVQTDFDGAFRIPDVQAGIYEVELKYVGYRNYRMERVRVPEGGLKGLEYVMRQDIVDFPCCCWYPQPQQLIINQDPFGGSTTFRLDTKGMIRN